MPKLKVGVFVPYSGIYKTIKTDFFVGLESAIPEEIKKNISFHPEFVHTGSLKQVEDAFRKLVLYDSVDVLTGIVSTPVTSNLLKCIDAEKIPSIINNLGGYLPGKDLSSPYLFYNSMHLWKSEWAVGKWMQHKFGGVPAIGTSLYDSGYHLTGSFRIGTVAAGAEECRLHTLKPSDLKSFTETQPLVDIISDEQPAHAHLILSGAEGRGFLKNFYSNDISQIIPISVNPFMVDDGEFADFEFCDSIINALTWSYSLENEHNNSFKTQYSKFSYTIPNVFSLLGYETGLIIAETLTKINDLGLNKSGFLKALGDVDLTGPRGKIYTSTTDLHTTQPAHIRAAKVNPETGVFENEIIATIDGIDWNNPTLLSVAQAAQSWQNPYLCV